jgi:hypothetical protein
MRRLKCLLIATVIAVGVAAASPAATLAADSLKVPQPMFVLDSQNEFFATYSMISTVSGQFEHTRWEMGVALTCDDGAKRGIGGRFDSEKQKFFVNSPAAVVPIPLGSLCEATATWNAGGGGCGTCDGVGSSPPMTFAVPPGQPRTRYNGLEKDTATRTRDAARELAARYYKGCAANNGGFDCVWAGIYEATAAYQNHIVNDPPDKNFRKRVKVSRPAPRKFTAAEAGSAAAALNKFTAAASDALAASGALAKAIDRAQGATLAKKPKDERVQMLDAARFAGLLATALDRFAARSTAAAAAVDAAKPPAFAAMPLEPGEWTQLRFGIVADGLPAPLSAELKRLRLPPDMVTDARGALATVETPAAADSPGAGLGDPELLAAVRSSAKMLRKWAKKVQRGR